MKLSKEQVISQGHTELHARVGGILQSHRFILQKEKTGFGIVSVLVTAGNVPVGELARLADEIGIPLRSPLGIAFPKGKGPKDFVQA